MENKAHALAAGIFVLLVGGLVVALAAWLTRDSGVSNLYELSTREAVSGLQPQAAVRYRGIDIGKVVHIGFDPQETGNALVRIAVDERAPITKSTYATLGYQGVTGLAYVQLDDEGESKEPLATNTGAPPRIPMRPGTLSKVTDRGLAIMVQAEQTMAQARDTMARISELLSAQNQTALVATVTDLGAAAKGISRTAGSFDQVAADARGTLRAIEATSAELTKTAAATTVAASEFGGTIRRIGERFEATAQALASTANTLNSTTLPSVHRVSDDTSLTLRQAAGVFSAFNDNPQALIYGSGAIPPGPGEPGFVSPGSAR